MLLMTDGRSPAAQKVFAAAAPLIEALDIELVDVEYVRENQARILRLYIDKPDGVTVEDCATVSRMVDPVIDHELGLKTHDYLEVSSPGLQRILKTERDFKRYEGEWVEVTLYRALDGRRKYQGVLGPYASDQVVIRLEDDSERIFARELVARTRRFLRG
jgi:ribosome maturation factor RimP